ncbi:hypothetical protein L204_100967 [Cryptococcus depauperatus]
MRANMPAEGQIIAAIIEILDRDSSPHPYFSAPAISIAHLASALHISPSSLSPSYCASLIRPLADNLFDVPREPVVRSLEQKDKEWIVFVSLSRPGEVSRSQSERGMRRDEREPVLPRPPMRRGKTSNALTDHPQDTTELNILHLVPTLPGGSDYVSTPLRSSKRKGFFQSLGLQRNKSSSQPPSPTAMALEEKEKRIQEDYIRKMAEQETKKETFDPMRDVPPPISVVYREANPVLLGNGLLGVPGPRYMNRQPHVGHEMKAEEDDREEIDIISSYGGDSPDESSEELKDKENKDVSIGKVPAPRKTPDDLPPVKSGHDGQMAVDYGSRTRKDRDKEERIDSFDLEAEDNGEEVDKLKEKRKGQKREGADRKVSFVDREEQKSHRYSEPASEEEEGAQQSEYDTEDKKKDHDQESKQRHTRERTHEKKQKNDKKMYESDNDNDKEERRRHKDRHKSERKHREKDEDEQRDERRDERRSKHKSKNKDKEKERTHRHKHREQVDEDESGNTSMPWLAATFEDLPFGPDVSGIKIVDWMKKRWQLMFAEILAVLGLVYVLQAAGL